VPPPPYRHFELMVELLAPRRMLQVFEARLDGRLIASMLCFTFKNIFSAGYIGIDYRSLPAHPVKAVDWAALAWAAQAGYQEFDFLQSHVRNAGLRWYKRSFGAIEVPVTYHYFPRVGGTAQLRELLVGRRAGPASLARGLVRHLPTPALRALGALVFPHVG
jgi:GNAT acetyltransferase-like protein